jgi:hypothetical protein
MGILVPTYKIIANATWSNVNLREADLLNWRLRLCLELYAHELCRCHEQSAKMTKTWSADWRDQTSDRTEKLKMSIPTYWIIANATWTYVKPKCWIGDCSSAFHVHMSTAHASRSSITLRFKISPLLCVLVSSLKRWTLFLLSLFFARALVHRSILRHQPRVHADDIRNSVYLWKTANTDKFKKNRSGQHHFIEIFAWDRTACKKKLRLGLRCQKFAAIDSCFIWRTAIKEQEQTPPDQGLGDYPKNSLAFVNSCRLYSSVSSKRWFIVVKCDKMWQKSQNGTTRRSHPTRTTNETTEENRHPKWGTTQCR